MTDPIQRSDQRVIRVKGLSAVVALAGLVCGNFIWQITSGHNDWGRALDLSYFQVVAVTSVLLVAGVRERRP